MADAIVWYRASVETQEVSSLEYRMAKIALHRIYGGGRSLRSFARAAPAE